MTAPKPPSSTPAPPVPFVRAAEPAAASISLKQAYLDWDWAVVVLGSWLAPLLAFNVHHWDLSYLASETFWLLPIVALLPRFYHETESGSRTRHAFYWTVGIILAAGSVLDLAFGRFLLLFLAPSYAGRIAGIPVEEFLFYFFGPVAMVLVYFWADEHFMKATSARTRRDHMDSSALLRFSPGLLAQALALALAGIAAKALLGGEGPWLPEYYSFLLVTAYLPLLFFWGSVRSLVNWQALSLTVLYTLVTSIVWELTLGVPLQWWGYQRGAMLGLWVRAWQQSLHADLPIEAVTVWLAAPFACVFFFEVIKALHYHPASGLKAKLFGPAAVAQPPDPAPAPAVPAARADADAPAPKSEARPGARSGARSGARPLARTLARTRKKSTKL